MDPVTNLASRRVVAHAALGTADAAGKVVRRGRVGPMLCGMVVGAAVGSLLGLTIIELILPGIAIGAILGVVIAGAIFRSPVPALGAADAAGQAQPPGQVRRYWRHDREGVHVLALMDRAIFLLHSHDEPDLQGIFTQLDSAERPNIEDSNFIPFSTFKWMQWREDESRAVRFYYAPRSNPAATRWGIMFFGTDRVREEFIAQALAQGLAGKRAAGTMTTARAVLAPLIVTLLVSTVVALLTWATYACAQEAARAKPNAPQTTNDGFVQLLVFLGPVNVALIGLLLIGVAATWLVYRLRRPPLLHVVSAVPFDMVRGFCYGSDVTAFVNP